MAKIVHTERLKYIYALFYGLPGSGKTTLLGSILDVPSLLPVLWVNFAGNPESIVAKLNDDVVQMVELDRPDELGQVYDYLVKGQDVNHPFSKAVGGLKGGFKTLVIDQLTEVNRRILSRLFGTDSINTVVPTTEKGRDNRQLYDTSLSYMMGLSFSLYQRLELNVVIAAQESVSEWSEHFQVNLYGQAKSEVPSHARLVGRLAHASQFAEIDALAQVLKVPKQSIYNVLQLTPSKSVAAVKNQYLPNGPQYVINPSMQKIMDIIFKLEVK